MGLFFSMKGDLMFRKIFDTKKPQRSSDRFKSLIHTLSSMNEQDLAKVEKLLELYMLMFLLTANSNPISLDVEDFGFP